MDAEEVRSIVRRLGVPCVVPIVKEIEARQNPVDVYAGVRKKSRYSFLLESAEIGEKIARYSFLGSAPSKIIKLSRGMLEINGAKRKVENPMKHLREVLAGYKVYKGLQDLPGFFGGLIGYFAYDFVKYFEKIGESAKDDLKQNDAEFIFVSDLIAFDHIKNKILLISNLVIEDESEIERMLDEAREKINELERAVTASKSCAPVRGEKKVMFRSNLRQEDFKKAVRAAKNYIYAGDIFQVVLSQRFECDVNSNPLDVYQFLKEINPSPYMYFLEFGGLKIVGSSPEILVKVEGDKIVVRPIAGTRKRGRNAEEDEALAREMLDDPKERAEHVMLVDLGRNDVGKISKFGSVHVDEFMTVERYSHVQHIVSNVVGKLEDGRDSFDAVEASFPAGTVSGAPKVRAMQIIEELEPARRGIYGGAVGYFSFDMNMDFAITIRTIIIQNGRAYIQAGAGIVADSIPEREYQETVNKVKGMLRAIELAGRSGSVKTVKSTRSEGTMA